MNEENAYLTLLKAMDRMQGKLHIIESYIPLEEQSKYFVMANQIRRNIDKEAVLAKKDLLFDLDFDISLKRNLLVLLATLDEVEAYRAIELYAANPDEELRYWSKLALEESRMMMERIFSDREQIMIATGLGGRDDRLRFFVVFFPQEAESFTEFQQKTTEKEINYILSENDCEVENITVRGDYISFTALFPFRMDMRKIFSALLDEINQYGDFLSEHFLITNVKIFDENEILEYRAGQDKKDEKEIEAEEEGKKEDNDEEEGKDI